MNEYIRRKPITSEAIRWSGHNADAIFNFVGPAAEIREDGDLYITTPVGVELVPLGWYVMRGAAGDCYPVEA